MYLKGGANMQKDTYHNEYEDSIESLYDELRLIKPYNVYDFINCFCSFLNDSLGTPEERIKSILYKNTIHRFIKVKISRNLFSIGVLPLHVIDNKKIMFSLMAGDISFMHIGFFETINHEYILDDNYILDICEINLESLNHLAKSKNISIIDVKDRENIFNHFI
jgi:hypothetical protein